MDEPQEIMQFDSTLGGAENLPSEVHILKFAAARSKEIAAMTECIMNPCSSKLVFQTLPVHMRRRIMSHNSKRLPRRLRNAYEAQLAKSGQPMKLKRPSRKHRRRPKNLLQEYNRRKRNHKWLETHIWHAKRFHMTEKWGYKLPLAPCDKAFRACYRATSKHCLLQDISYYPSIQISGEQKILTDGLKRITSPLCGLSITAQAYLSGKRAGSSYVYHLDKYPMNCVGKVTFFWNSQTSGNRQLWIFCHPSFYKEFLKLIVNCFNLSLQDNDNDCSLPIKKIKLNDSFVEDKEVNKIKELNMLNKVYTNRDGVVVTEMKDCVNRFRLTGPLSHAILSWALQPLPLPTNETKQTNWFTGLCKNNTFKNIHTTQENFWNKFRDLKSPSELPCHLIVGLNVKDPRTNYPQKRIKCMPGEKNDISVEDMTTLPNDLSHSQLWNGQIQKKISSNIKTTFELNKLKQENSLVPGEYCSAFDTIQGVAVILIQRPGSQDCQYKRVGYNSGWDIIVPSGYGMAFWLSLTLRGARAGGLRESSKIDYESGVPEVQPDTVASQVEELERSKTLLDKYFRLPPNKRVNFNKLSINSPFLCRWQVLCNDWALNKKNSSSFYVIRDRSILKCLQEILINKTTLPTFQWDKSALVPVRVTSINKGKLSDFALICLPTSSDVVSQKSSALVEPLKKDKNQSVRKEMRQKHKSELTKLKRRRVKVKRKLLEKSEKFIEVPKQNNTELNVKYAAEMRELWLSSKVDNVRNQCSRQVMGYVTHGDFSFTEAKGCGVGYVTLQSLKCLVEKKSKSKECLVLIRNNRSRQYRFANIQIIVGN